MTLRDLLEHPERASSVSREELPHLLADLKRLEVMLQLHLNTFNGHDPAQATPDTENWLTVKEAAERVQVNARWVYRHAPKKWRGFIKRVSRKKLLIRESGLTDWMRANKA